MWKILIIVTIVSALLPCHLGSPASVSHAAGVGGFKAAHPGANQPASKDVAVTSISQVGPPFANEGDTVTIRIGVSNAGSEDETFNVTLRDVTENIDIGRQTVTLAAGGSTTLSIAWNTDGASGGPAPPGPPTPGTIHALAATAVLPGDSNNSNNSMTLLPGIWIIAAPEAPGITYPEALEEPKVDYGEGLSLVAASTATEAVALSNMFLSAVEAEEETSTKGPDLLTEGEALTDVFNSSVDGETLTDLSAVDVTTATDILSEVFTGPVHANSNAALANPDINTVAAEIARITGDELQAKAETTLARPDVSTKAVPATGVFLLGREPYSVSDVSAPELSTEISPLTKVFGSNVNARAENALSVPLLDTGTEGQGFIYVEFAPSKSLEALAEPELITTKDVLKSVYSSISGATSVTRINPFGPNTREIPLSYIYLSPVHDAASGISSKPDFAIDSTTVEQPPLPGEVEIPPPAPTEVAPVETGTVRGRVRLEGQSHSLGAYVEIGSQVTFVDRHGYFLTQAPIDRFDLHIRAPGFLAVIVPGISVEPGHLAVIPTVTLAFGDADGDGVINLFDLFLVARNYGLSIKTVSFQ